MIRKEYPLVCRYLMAICMAERMQSIYWWPLSTHLRLCACRQFTGRRRNHRRKGWFVRRMTGVLGGLLRNKLSPDKGWEERIEEEMYPTPKSTRLSCSCVLQNSRLLERILFHSYMKWSCIELIKRQQIRQTTSVGEWL